MVESSPINRITADDMMSLVSERGSTPMQVGAVLLLDARSGLDPASAIDLLAQRIASVPRLRQRLQKTPFGCGRPVCVDDPAFEIANHVTSLRCPAPQGELAVLGLAAELIGANMPRNRPLWAATLVTDTAPGEAALILVFHHVLADGIGGLAVLANLVDGAPEMVNTGFPRAGPSRGQLAMDAARGRIRLLRRIPTAVSRIGSAASELRPAARAGAAPTSLNCSTGTRRSFVHIRVKVNRVHDEPPAPTMPR